MTDSQKHIQQELDNGVRGIFIFTSAFLLITAIGVLYALYI